MAHELKDTTWWEWLILATALWWWFWKAARIVGEGIDEEFRRSRQLTAAHFADLQDAIERNTDRIVAELAKTNRLIQPFAQDRLDDKAALLTQEMSTAVERLQADSLRE